MRLDKAERHFLESYTADMMEAIDQISTDLGLTENDHRIKGFNITEAFDKFSQYLEGYADYKLKNVRNEYATPQEGIKASVTAFIEQALFSDVDIKYADLPAFVKGYVEGCRKLSTSVNKAKDVLMDADMYDEAADVNDFCDQFMESVDSRFHPTMDRIIEASGYNSKSWLESHLNGTRKKTEKVQFI